MKLPQVGDFEDTNVGAIVEMPKTQAIDLTLNFEAIPGQTRSSHLGL